MRTNTDDTPSVEVTNRRGQTRMRLIDAAAQVYGTTRFGRVTVEQICECGGYTRGAFYSNFSSLDELFQAMWQQRSAAQLTEIQLAVDLAWERRPTDIVDLVLRIATGFPGDPQWYRINAEFTAQALHDATLKAALIDRTDAIIRTILPIVESVLNDLGRRIVGDRNDLGHALLSVHDGTTVQCLLDPEAVTFRRDLFRRILLSYSEPVPDRQQLRSASE